MQPNQPPNPNLSPSLEQPAQPGVEQSPVPVAPELAPNAPAAAPAADPPPQTQPQPVAAPALPGPLQPPQPPAPAAPVVPPPLAPNPAEASDVDVIEKSWVDQAEKVVDQTKDDPYVEEEAVEALQQDYLKKRYGHDVKKPDLN